MKTHKDAALEELFPSNYISVVHPINACVHDIRNMLAVVEGNASLLRMHGLSEKAQERIQSIENATHFSEALCSQLMKYLSLKAGSYELINLTETIDEIGLLLTSTVSKKATVDFELEQNLPYINAIPFQIKQVVTNLVINASQAIKNEEGAIRVSTNTSDCENFIDLAVTDNGCGIPKDILPNIFDGSFTTKEKGAGIGLSSVKEIVDNHQGAIVVNSTPNLGSTFKIRFPVKTNKQLEGEQK